MASLNSFNMARETAIDQDQRTIHVLRRTIRRLQDEIDHLKQALGTLSHPPAEWETDWGLTGPESIILAALIKHRVVTRDALMAALYSGRGPDAEPDSGIIDVFIYRIRRKLRPRGIAIVTVRERGWMLSPEDRRRLSGITGRAK
jgi:two-component system, cell cycle response regulator CtrA